MDVLPAFGVELIEGLPGSGKSLRCVDQLLVDVVRDRRPVWTNLPLRMRVVRTYLRNRGGEPLAGLVHSLTKEHFEAFCIRQCRLHEFREARRDWARDMSTGQRNAALVREFERLNGPDVCDGEGANWIPACAIICIDEVHQWYPQGGEKMEREEVRKYITMHRHHAHLVRICSQNRMQVSLSFRRNMTKLVMVHAKAEDSMGFGLKFKHCGLRLIGYAEFNGDQVRESELKHDMKPLREDVLWPGAPWNQHLFRLYNSYSHVGSRAQMRRVLERARQQAGLTAEGAVKKVEENKGPETMKQKVFRQVLGTIRFWCRWGFRGVLAAAVLFLGVSIGRAMGSDVAKSKPGGPVVPAKAEAVKWGKWAGSSGDSVRIDGEKYKVGGVLPNGAVLRYLSARPRSLVLERGDRVYVWRFGAAAPVDVGTKSQVLDAVSRVKGRDGAGGGVGRAAVESLGGVEPPARVPVGSPTSVGGGRE